MFNNEEVYKSWKSCLLQYSALDRIKIMPYYTTFFVRQAGRRHIHRISSRHSLLNLLLQSIILAIKCSSNGIGKQLSYYYGQKWIHRSRYGGALKLFGVDADEKN